VKVNLNVHTSMYFE